MAGLLEGKEVEGKIGEVGGYFVDVSKDGMVEVGVSIEVKPLEGDVVVKSENSAKVHLLTILEKQCKKNDKVWDDAVVAQLKGILGLIG